MQNMQFYLSHKLQNCVTQDAPRGHLAYSLYSTRNLSVKHSHIDTDIRMNLNARIAHQVYIPIWPIHISGELLYILPASSEVQ